MRRLLDHLRRSWPWALLGVAGFPVLVVILWHVLPPPPGVTLDVGGDPRLVVFSPDGRLLAVTTNLRQYSESPLQVWDVAARRKVFSTLEAGASEDSIRFSPDGRLLAARGPKGPMFWNVETGAELTTLNGAASVHFPGCTFSPDARYVFLRFDSINQPRDDRLQCWEASTEMLRGEIPGLHADLTFATDMTVKSTSGTVRRSGPGSRPCASPYPGGCWSSFPRAW
jgi:WD40 repeat protein